jgi:hypothetical protein
LKPAEAIEDLRAVGAAGLKHAGAAGVRVAERFAVFEQALAAGQRIMLDQVLGLSPGRGGTSLIEADRLQRRSALISGIAAQHFAATPLIKSRRALALAAAIAGYETRGRWHRDRRHGRPPIERNQGLDAALFDLLALGLPVTFRVVKNALNAKAQRDQSVPLPRNTPFSPSPETATLAITRPTDAGADDGRSPT